MISLDSLITILGMLAVTYTTRLIGFFALRNRSLSPKAAAVLDAAPGCVLIAVIAPYFVTDKPHELAAMAVTLCTARYFGMLPTVLAAVGSAALFGQVFG
ncbi:membrane protein [Neisseria arctica]|uniref:Membrane protein n=1 Tax=Neisseria arctica TaxID=1470200 RepID=A0A0J1C2R4_9NEIS|nr:AzlD family protein [Neisseria arctica]KLT72568.1 membrane protein [Neisseria arctica]UOO87622.1 AzlD family protein [Neisseria arctica]